MRRKIALTLSLLTALVVLTAFYLRLIPFFKYSHYGIWLQYDDSMFEYWLSKTLYKHGLLYWYQLTPENTRYLWWWPQGRDIRKTETPGLSFTGASLYPLAKAFGLRLVDWVGIIPAFYGTLAVVSSALLGYVVGGPLLALIVSVSTAYQYAFMQRSIASFVEKMAPCLFFGTLYLIFLAYFNKRRNELGLAQTILLGVLGGLTLMFAAAFWGGFLMFVGITTIFVMLMPYLTRDKDYYKMIFAFLLSATLSFYLSSFWITTLWLGKLWLFTLIVYVVTFFYLGLSYYTVTRVGKERLTKLWTLIVAASLVALASIASHPYVLNRLLTGRYVMMLLPWLRKVESPLARSVAEHQGIFNVYSITDLVNIMGIGLAAPFALIIAIYKFMKKETEDVILTLPIIALGLFASYMLFANTSVYLLTPIGYLSALAGALALFWCFNEFNKKSSLLKIIWGTLAVSFVALLVAGISWGIRFAINYPPPSFLSAGTAFYTPLFPDAMKSVTKNCKFVLAWWDYGYMLGVVGHATTAVDPATLNATKIQLVAKALTSKESDVLKVLREFKMLTNKTCVFAYEVFPLVNKNTVMLAPQAGDFAKSVWMFRIAGYSDKTIFSKFIKVYYVVIGENAAGNQVVLVVNSPKDIQATPRGVIVRVPGKGVVLLTRVITVSTRPIYDIKDVFLYRAIYASLIKGGYRVVDSLGRPVNQDVEFEHFKLLKPVIDHLYIPNTNKQIPWIGVVAILRYVS